MNKEKVKSNVCQIEYCDRPTHKESEYCIFHASAEEKTEEEFKEALKKYIEEIKKEDKDYKFGRFIFIGDINFKEDLNITIFNHADFRVTTFEGNARFGGVTFKKYADFSWATFKGGALFFDAIFEGGAVFSDAIFESVAFFKGATFREYASFKGSSFLRCVSFEGVKLLPGNKLIFEVKNDIVENYLRDRVSFSGAYLEDAYLDIRLAIGVLTVSYTHLTLPTN